MSQPEVTYNSFLIDFLIAPKYRIGRHVLLMLFFTFVAFNMPYLTCAGFLDKVGNVIGYASLILLVSYLGGIYLHMYVLLPQLLLKNRYILYIITVSLLILVMIAVSFGSDYWLNWYSGQEPGYYSFFYEKRIMSIEIVSNFFLYGLLIGGTSITILLRHWLGVYQRKNELEKVNLKTELELLKDQINPEFLFNMLDEAGKQTFDNPAQASKVLMELSRLLRYQLYDGKREKVLLISEISFIEHFLELARMRYANLSFTVTKEGEVSRKLVPPLLFIPFAIHYVKLLPSEDSRMDIHFRFRAGERELHFSCICFASGMPGGQIENSEDLKDVKQRLDLLFKDSYKLDAVDDGGICKTNLCIRL